MKMMAENPVPGHPEPSPTTGRTKRPNPSHAVTGGRFFCYIAPAGVTKEPSPCYVIILINSHNNITAYETKTTTTSARAAHDGGDGRLGTECHDDVQG